MARPDRFLLWGVLGAALLGLAGPARGDDLAAQLRGLKPDVFAADSDAAKQRSQMVARDVQARLDAAIDRQGKLFLDVKTRADWDRFRDARIAALRESLGPFPDPPKEVKVKVTRTLEGDGYRIDNLVYESRPGLVVTANLYRPAEPAKSMPGVVICQGFLHPKTQTELQDCGIAWARQGCVVLVPDVLGHGERRHHPFTDSSRYPRKFAVNRQDYFSRANMSAELYVAGESLMGWMVWDVMRGIDVMLARPGVDRERIVLAGAVAAGGDIAAVTAARDRRVAVVVSYNFGGPEPETPYPLPNDPEKVYPYATGHWDSTRRLRLSARDGFLPWVIAGSVAPRRLVYAHEFAWDRDHDPVWPRLKTIFELSEARDSLASVAGKGTLDGKPEDGTGCANIGAYHRQELQPILKRWIDLPEPSRKAANHYTVEDLQCLTPEAVEAFKPRAVHELAADIGNAHLAAARKRLAEMPEDNRVRQIQGDWERLLGVAGPKDDPKSSEHGRERLGDITVERVVITAEPGILVPLLLLLPPKKEGLRLPVVVGIAQHGKQGFLQQRSEALAELLGNGGAVCLPDVRGTGETTPQGDRRGPPAGGYKTVAANSASTMLASQELMLGRTLLGSRLYDLRVVLRWLRSRPDLDANRIALWGDSFAAVNADGRTLEVPWDADDLPAQSEPLGGLLALLGALFEKDVCAVAVRGGLVGFGSLLESRFCYVPHDAVVPGVLAVGDVSDIAASVAPRPLRLEGLVDGLNRPAGDAVDKVFEVARKTYRAADAADNLRLVAKDDGSAAGTWLRERLKEKR